jgi:TRAP-type C4-dicarboxylate transport system permease small subunit
VISTVTGAILAATTPTLPDNVGYVAAAYLVFFVLVLIYLVIMASKLTRFERELAELNDVAEQRARARTDAQREREGAGAR